MPASETKELLNVFHLNIHYHDNFSLRLKPSRRFLPFPLQEFGKWGREVMKEAAGRLGDKTLGEGRGGKGGV